MFRFLDLPAELIIEILATVPDYRTVVGCTLVCKALRTIITTSDRLLYKIELDASGFVDNPGSELSISRRLDLLRDLQTRWGSMVPSKIDHYSIEQKIRGCIKLCQGYLCYSQGWQGGQEVVTIMRLPSSLTGAEHDQWQLPAFSFNILSLDIDPSQDLLVLSTSQRIEQDPATAEHILHFISMRTGEPHPLSEHHEAKIPGLHTAWSLTKVQIQGGLVALFITLSGRTSCFAVVDWKSSEMKLYTQAAAGILVDPTHAVVIKRVEDNDLFELQIYGMQEVDEENQTPTFDLIRTLGLPEDFRANTEEGEIQISTPYGGCLPSESCPPPGAPFFRPNTSPHILAFRIARAVSFENYTFVGVLCFRHQIFLQGDPDRDRSAPLPWSTWNVDNTAWFYPQYSSKLLDPYINAERALVWQSADIRRAKLELRDMNPAQARRQSGTPKTAKIRVGGVLLNSYLPQKVSCSGPVPQLIHTLLMDDERVVIVHIQSVHTGGEVGARKKNIEVWNMV